jgi:hypothetical protein
MQDKWNDWKENSGAVLTNGFGTLFYQLNGNLKK